MSLDSDVIVDRRRIRRKLTFWRVAAGLVAIAAIVTVGAIATKSGPAALAASGSIARVNIEGLIRSDTTFYPGFSGGPLIDVSGRVIGLNTSALSRGRPAKVPDRICSKPLTASAIGSTS